MATAKKSSSSKGKKTGVQVRDMKPRKNPKGGGSGTIVVWHPGGPPTPSP